MKNCNNYFTKIFVNVLHDLKIKTSMVARKSKFGINRTNSILK